MDATPSPPPRSPCPGEASEGGSEGMASPDPMINLQDLTHSTASGAIRRASSRVKGSRYPNVEVGWRCVECQLASWGLVPSHLFECTRACPLKGEDAVPIILHANHYPTLVLRLVMERLGEGTALGVWQSLCRAVGVLALGIIMQHEHREPRTITGTCVLQHLSVARRVAERSVIDHQMDAFG